MDGKKGISVPHKHLHARISYLYQAATYLANASQHDGPRTNTSRINSTITGMEFQGKKGNGVEKVENAQFNVDEDSSLPTHSNSLTNANGNIESTRLLSHLRSVSLKSQIRLSPAMKHSICKRCNSLLIPGRTSSNRMENKSRGGKKAWADLLVVTCDICGMVKRFAVGATSPHKRTERKKGGSGAAESGSILS